MKKLIAAAAVALCLGAAHAQEPAQIRPPEAGEARPVEAPPAVAPPDAAPPSEDKPAQRPMRGGPRSHGMAMKQFVCKAVEDGRGKSGQELANTIEAMVTQFSHANYQLSALLPGDPPIACFHSLSDPSKLPRGAR